MYEIKYKKKALKELSVIDNKVARNILEKINKISQNPQRKDLDIKKLKGLKKVYRLRYREYRVIYEINNNELVITVIKIGARGGIYA